MSSDVTSTYSQHNLNEAKQSGGEIYEFEDFRLDARRLMLYRGNQTIALKPKVIETLVALVESSGEVVGKDELMNRLWSNSIVEESNLTQNIYLLRKTLGQTADGKPLIETFRRRGYRFNGQVKKTYKSDQNETAKVENQAQPNVPETGFGAEPDGGPPPLFGEKSPSTEKTAFVEAEKAQSSVSSKNKIWYFLAGAAAFGLLILAIYVAPSFFGIPKASQGRAESYAAPPNSNLKITRLTPDINVENPTISPDGKRLVYAKRESNKRSVWLTDIETGNSKQIMPPTTGGYDAFQFSPDGSQIYLVIYQQVEPKFVIARIPLTGGTEQKIAKNTMSPFTVSPDGKQLAFMRDQELTIANTDGSGERVLARRDRQTGWFESWGSQPSWSPDGERIAICGGRVEQGKAHPELLEISVADGAQKVIPTPSNWNSLDDVQWLPDETGLLVNAREASGAPFQIWHISYPAGEIRRITQDFQNYDWLSITNDSRLLIAEQENTRYNIWTAPLADTNQVKQLTFGASANDGYWGMAFMPDGKIIYTSPRNGNLDLWMMNPDGSNQHQLTASAGDDARPIVTPNSRYIVFRSTITDLERIWRIDADGGNPTQLTGGDGYQTQPVVSPDGKWVYYLQADGEHGDIWKIPIEGGEPVRVSRHGKIVRLFSISPDKKLLVFEQYVKDSKVPWQIGLMKTDNGEVIRLFETKMNGRIQWTADSKSLIYIENHDAMNLMQQPLDGGEPRPITNFNSQQIRAFEIAPDWQNVVFSRGNITSEAVLITNFR